MPRRKGVSSQSSQDAAMQRVENNIGNALDTIEAGVNRKEAAGSYRWSPESEAAKTEVLQGIRQLSAADDARFNLELGVPDVSDFTPNFGHGVFRKTGSEQHGGEVLRQLDPQLAERVKKNFPWLVLLGGVILTIGIQQNWDKIQAVLAGQPSEPTPVAATAQPENSTDEE